MSKTNRALAVGVSRYRPPISDLPAVAADVREIAKLLGSRDGAFQRSHTRVLADRSATKDSVESALAEAFGAEDTAFVYLAGHGAVVDGEYYFLPSDTDNADLPNSAISLSEVKRQFDAYKGRRVFVWLDCCHSGGVLKRRATANETATLKQMLQVVQGEGRVILAACTAEQSAYEDASHGLFTGALLRGLRGAAEQAGEVTANSLYEYIDRQIGQERQRPMLFGQMTGRIVLMNYSGRGPTPTPTPTPKRPSKQPQAAKPKKKISKRPPASNTVLLGRGFVDAKSALQDTNGCFTLTIPSTDAERDAMMQTLRPKEFERRTIRFAHRNDACDAVVKSVSAEATSKGQLWSLTLEPTEFTERHQPFGSISENGVAYSDDEIAELRARVILLNERPPLSRRGFSGLSLVHNAIGTTGRGEPIPCVVREAYEGHRSQRTKWRQFARLLAVYTLKKTGTVEHVLELDLGTVRNGALPVSFRGRRAARYANDEPATIRVSGECLLA